MSVVLHEDEDGARSIRLRACCVQIHLITALLLSQQTSFRNQIATIFSTLTLKMTNGGHLQNVALVGVRIQRHAMPQMQ